jgi:hypothetical protein
MKVGAALKTVFLFGALVTVSRVYGYTASDYTNAGLRLYNQKNYAMAVRYFTAALTMIPPDPRALQARANCYYFMGQYQAALADYEKLLAQSPSGPVSQFVQALKAKIGTAPATAPGISAPTASATAVEAAGSAGEKPSGLGLRVEPAFMTLSLTDFNNNAQTGKAFATQAGLQYDSSVPSAIVAVGVEPIGRLGGGFEIGLPFNILTIGKATQTYQDSNGYNQTVSFDVSSFSVGLNARYAFGNGVVRPFIGAGGLLAPIGINYTDISNTPPPSTTTSISGTFSGMAFGAQGQLGVDFHVGDPFVISIFGGYETATANSFKGSVTTSGTGTSTTDNGQLGVATSSSGPYITFLKDGDPAPTGFRPLQVDLTGILAGIHLSLFF